MSLAAVYHAPASAARLWWVVDVRGQRVGRAATEIARLLQGKHKPLYTPHVDVGDHVIVVNARHVELTGKKWQQKYYRRHTGYPGGLVEAKAKNYHAEHPTRILQHAVRGMLGHNTPTRRNRINRLLLYADDSHPHAAQSPVQYALNNTKNADFTANWELNQPVYKVTLQRATPSSSDTLGPWELVTEEPKLTKMEAKELRIAKRAGLNGPSFKRKPHPDGYVRGGFPRHGIRYYCTAPSLQPSE